MNGDFVYMVTFDGYFGSYGTENYLLGIFPSQEKAEEAAKNFKEFAKENLTDYDDRENASANVTPVYFGEALPLEYDGEYWYEHIKTPICLGRYIE